MLVGLSDQNMLPGGPEGRRAHLNNQVISAVEWVLQTPSLAQLCYKNNRRSIYPVSMDRGSSNRYVWGHTVTSLCQVIIIFRQPNLTTISHIITRSIQVDSLWPGDLYDWVTSMTGKREKGSNVERYLVI